MYSSRKQARWRIGINAQLLSGRQDYRRAGIHHYISQLLNHLPRDDARFHYTLFTNHMDDLEADWHDHVAPTRWPTGHPAGRIAWEQLAWPVSASRLRLDLLHAMGFVSPMLSKRPSVVTVYDLSFLHFPERFPFLKRVYLSGQTRRSCRQARRVLAISESTRRDIASSFGIPLSRIAVISPGVDARFSRRPTEQVEAFRERFGLPSRFFLHVGTLQPRKNLSLLLDAFAELDRPQVGLVLVGGRGWFYEKFFTRVRDLGLEGRVHFPGYVSDEDLPYWYNASLALIFPSVYEGFGLPVLQAMACGTPVIASNAAAVPEVTGPDALLFNPSDKQALVDHMANVLDDPQVVVKMQEMGLDRAGRYSWEESGRALSEVYERALTEK